MKLENLKRQNRRYDEKQFEIYSETLKNNPHMPKNVEDFIDLKYYKDKLEEWKDLKLRRQIRTNYNLNIKLVTKKK